MFPKLILKFVCCVSAGYLLLSSLHVFPPGWRRSSDDFSWNKDSGFPSLSVKCFVLWNNMKPSPAVRLSPRLIITSDRWHGNTDLLACIPGFKVQLPMQMFLAQRCLWLSELSLGVKILTMRREMFLPNILTGNVTAATAEHQINLISAYKWFIISSLNYFENN